MIISISCDIKFCQQSERDYMDAIDIVINRRVLDEVMIILKSSYTMRENNSKWRILFTAKYMGHVFGCLC